MKPLEALAAAHLQETVRPRARTWFEMDEDDEPTGEIRTIRTLVMATSVVAEHVAIAEVARMLVEQRVPAIVVSDATGTPCGIVTAHDVLRGRPDWTAADAMSHVATQEAMAGIHATAELMSREHVEYVVVLDEAEILGVVTALDVLANTLA